MTGGTRRLVTTVSFKNADKEPATLMTRNSSRLGLFLEKPSSRVVTTSTTPVLWMAPLMIKIDPKIMMMSLLKPENKDLVAKVQSLVAGPTFDAALAARKPRVALLATWT